MEHKLYWLEVLGKEYELMFDEVVKIEIYEEDPRNMGGAVSTIFQVTYSNERVLTIRSSEYAAIYLKDAGNSKKEMK